MYTHNYLSSYMENSGRFKSGRTETPEQKSKRVVALKEAWKTRKDRHGMMGTKFYNSWRSMTTRCRGTAGEGSKKKYRDKGIKVCERWQDFKNFYEDMFPSYIEGRTIDRKDNKLGYFKENCRWATPVQQSNNTSATVKITYDGSTLSIREWSEKLGVSRDSLKLRYHRRYLPGLITLDELMSFRGRNK